MLYNNSFKTHISKILCTENIIYIYCIYTKTTYKS